MTAVRDFRADYETATERCGLLDRSDRGKLALTGAGAKEFLQGQVSNDVLALTPGSGCYAAFLTPKGKMLGDIRILDAGDEILLDTERVALQELFNMIRRFSLGYAVELHKRTLQRGLLSLIGPDSDTVATGATATGAAVITGGGAATENWHTATEIAGVPVRLISTDTGLDVLCDAEATGAVRAALLDAGAVEVGEDAAECVRIERGRPRYGVDADETVIPQEAGLNERAVSFTKGCYVGQETVARLHYRGKPNRELRGLRSPAPLHPGTTLQHDGREVGTITSTASSPRLGEIALALVRREAPPGTVVQAGDGGHAEVVVLPFAPTDE